MIVFMLLGTQVAVASTQVDSSGFRITTSQLIQNKNRVIGQEVGCSCVTSNDRLWVYRDEGNTPISQNLDQESDFDGTLWLFDSGNTGKVQIAVLFHRVDGQLTADLYQDQDGDGRVAVDLDRDVPTITEPGTWSIRTTAVDGYWQRDGRIAPDFDILVDDRFMATFGGQLYEASMANDGVVDVVVHVRGPQGNDPRSYDWRNVYTPVSASSGIYRSTLTVREEGTEPAFAPAFPWYLLGPSLGLVKPYGESFPPIQVDWTTGRLTYLGEFVASRGSDENWFTYSINRIEPGMTTDPDFESPFAFYDLAGDQDSVPELQIRAERYFANDPFSPLAGAAQARALQQIRYSWDQDNTQNWSFKLGLLGQNPIDGTVAFPDFTLKTVPYDQFPSWVTGHSWDIASFVAAEQPLWTTEGIYDGDPSGPVRNDYFAGQGDATGGFGEQVESGRRVEYTLQLNDRPWLYVSPIDHKLHLAKATAGTWNIDGQRELRYLNDGGGTAFDGWQLWDGGRLVSQLYRIPGGLLYSGDDGTFVARVDVPDELFRTLPPTTPEEWSRLGDQLKQNATDIAPGDLRAMFDQFGRGTQLSTGPILDFARADSGIAVTLAVADTATQAALSALVGGPVGSGLQVASLGGGRWSVTEATLERPSLTIAATPADSLQTAPVDVTVENPGSLPLDDAMLVVQAIASDGKTGVQLGNMPLEIAGGATQTHSFSWSPGRSGNWTIQATITRDTMTPRTQARTVLVQQDQSVHVPGVEPIAPSVAGKLGWTGFLAGRVLLLLGLLLLCGGAGAAVLWRGLSIG